MSRKSLPRLKDSESASLPVLPNKLPKKGLDVEHCAAIEKIVEAYDSSFDAAQFRDALIWAADKVKKSNPSLPIDERFSDPLAMVDELIKSKADSTTIMAAILYPIARPTRENKGLNEERLREIEKKFTNGKKIAKLVKRTLHFRALNLPLTIADSFDDLTKPKQREKADKNIKLFRLMSLWAAHDPRAILIGATQLTLHLRSEDDNPGFFDRETLRRLLINANHVYSDLTYIAGYGKVRERLMNFYYKLHDPQGIANAWAESNKGYDEEDGKNIEKVLTRRIEDEFNWQRGVHFDVEFRKKKGWAIYEKCKRQNKDVDKLADLLGIRILLKLPAVEWTGESNIDKLSVDERDYLVGAPGEIGALGELALKVHGRLGHIFGRYSTAHTHEEKNRATGKSVYFSWIQRRFAELAIAEPRDADPVKVADPERFAKEKELYPNIKDSRFEDRVNLPKDSGVSFIKDLFVFFLPNRTRPFEVEAQIVDVIRHDMNENGPRSGHHAYKAGLHTFADSVTAWFAAVAVEFDGVMNRNKRTYVFDNGGNVYDLSKKPQVHEFIEAAGLTGKCNEVSVTSIFGEREPGVTRGPGSVLTNGCMITPLKLAR